MFYVIILLFIFAPNASFSKNQDKFFSIENFNSKLKNDFNYYELYSTNPNLFQNIITIWDEKLSILDKDKTVEFLTTKTEKVEPTPQAEEIKMLKMRLDVLQKQIGQLALGSSSGGGEVRLEFLDDIDRTTAKVDGKVLKYSTADSKWVGATDISGGNWTKVVANGNGSTTNFTVGADLNVNNFFIFLNGVHQESTSDFTYSGTTLTMGTAPAVGDRLVIMYATTAG